MKPIIIENALPELLFKRFQREMLSFNIEWHYMETTSYRGVSGMNDESFSHTALFDGQKTSDLLYMYESALLAGLSKTDIQPVSLIRLRAGMFIPKVDNFIHPPHIDHEFEHLTALLYVNDSDGDTILYKEKYEDIGLNPQDYFEMKLNKSVTEDVRITPKQNTMVIFDGRTYHSSSSPSSNRRVVCNFNFI